MCYIPLLSLLILMPKLSLIWPREPFGADFCIPWTRPHHTLSAFFHSKVLQAHLVHSHPVQGADIALKNIASFPWKRAFKDHDPSDKYAHYFWVVTAPGPRPRKEPRNINVKLQPCTPQLILVLSLFAAVAPSSNCERLGFLYPSYFLPFIGFIPA